MTTTGLVLAAGSSRRLGVPKQLLSFRSKTLLDATLDMARSCEFDQLLVAIGGSSQQIHEQVDLSGIEVVENSEFASGCSSSIKASIQVVDSSATGLLLLLGDQPCVDPSVVQMLIESSNNSEIAVCEYNDGIGHPFWFASSMFEPLAAMHGDKAVWKLVESGQHIVNKLESRTPTPLDVDTWDDYDALLKQDRNSTLITNLDE